MRAYRKMPSLNGVGAGSIATLNLPIGLTYHQLYFKLGGTSFELKHIEEIRVKGNGKDLFVCTGPDLEKANRFNGLAAFSTVDRLLVLDFERPNLLTRAAREATAIGTGAPMSTAEGPGFNPVPLATLQVEIDIAHDAVNPQITCKASQSGTSPLGGLVKRRRFNRSVAGAGSLEIADLPRGDAIDKIWIHHGGNVKRVVLESDNYRVFDRTVEENNRVQADGVRVPQTNLFVIDPTEGGAGSEAIISQVQDFRISVDTDGPEELLIYVDYLGGFGGN